VQPYALPVGDLQAVALAAHMEWVQSDPVRVTEVQAAIAAEPKPIHVPRERPPLVVVDEGPLILVETRKDLTQMAMPFT
jgi:ribonuclease E